MNKRMTKIIYLGCLSRTRYPETCENAIKIIQYLDDDYQVLEDPPCCGSLSYHVASEEKLKEHVNHVNEWFKEHDVEELVTICAGCYNYLSHYYKEYLGDDFKVNVRHLLQFLDNEEYLEKLSLKHDGKKLRVNYHDACHLRNADVPIVEEPRRILNSIENIELREMENEKELSICCGAGGGVYSIFRENSDLNGKSIFDQMRRTKALLTACPFCYTALKRVEEEQGMRNPVVKFEDFIAKLMGGVDPTK
ncbi:MAG: CoB--CoM heterodisulfide reductase iron-sulfur subunit D [Promethearchaeota archaeon]|nr:MAG: CoB--CoM heterodisulfide reductase iron-sulfur subunit D [Candidatus Lokiarchaeota archaeon]